MLTSEHASELVLSHANYQDVQQHRRLCGSEGGSPPTLIVYCDLNKCKALMSMPGFLEFWRENSISGFWVLKGSLFLLNVPITINQTH